MAVVPMFLFVVLLAITEGQMGSWDDDFEFATYLEENHQFRVYWDHLNDDVIEIGMEANTTGWIAIGLSPNGGMENSDIMIGWVDDDDGSVTLQDRYTGDSMTRPSLDDEDHLTLIEGEQKDGITRIRFQRTRTLDCDDASGHDMAVTQGTSRVIYAWNDNDGDEDNANSIDYHGANQRGAQSVNLWYGEGDVVELEDDVDFFDLTFTNWSVSSNETSYICKVFELPSFNDTQHAVMVAPIVEAGNEGTVHHILMYSCPTDSINGTIDDSHQRDCEEWENMPSPDCRFAQMTVAWAIGGGDLYFPEEAGLPLSGDSSFHYAFLEIHYDNPEHRSDIVDSSGFRVWYTQTLRENDIAVLWLGALTNPLGLFMVPDTVSTYTGFCTSNCTASKLPTEGVTAFASFLHAHKVGYAITLRHVRDGVELEPLEINEHYDFDYQQTTVFDETVTLLPGDQFFVECTYDTTDREEMVLAGLGSKQEMCIGFVYVYPAPDFYYCTSNFAPTAANQWLDDAYDLGFWDVNMSGVNIDQMLSDGNISRPSDYPPASWQYIGGYWNKDMEGATEFYEKFWNDDTYSDRETYCFEANGFSRGRNDSIVINETSFEEEFGEFEEYCTDSCGCGTTTTTSESEEEESNNMDDDEEGNGMLVAVILLAMVLVIAIGVIVFLVAKNRKLEQQVIGGAVTVKGIHVPQTSTADRSQ